MLAASVAAAASGVHAGNAARRLARQRIRPGDIAALEPASLSQNGRLVAFVAEPSDGRVRSCCRSVYVLDRTTGAISHESRNADGTAPSGDSGAPRLNADGRVIAFETLADSLLPAPGRRPGRRVVVRDRLTGGMRTPGAGGVAPDGETSQPVLSASGRAVAFTSDATNLAKEPDTDGDEPDVYLWRLDTDTIEPVSLNTDPRQRWSGASHSPSISRDGNLVAFVSSARLAPEDTNSVPDVYLRDIPRGRTWVVSLGAGGRAADAGSFSPALSADGRYVAFVSMATNLGATDRNHDSDIYIHDLATGATTIVSGTGGGEAANSGSRRPALASDGRLVVYQSVASNLGSAPGCPPAPQDTNLLPDIYLLDRETQCVSRISGSSAAVWWSPSVAPAIDEAGTIVLFSSTHQVGGEMTSELSLFERAVVGLFR
jgi:Tol biopolymer transport system component